MNFSKAFCFISLLLICLFAGCKKYPEDDKRYLFKSPIHRLSQASRGGTWHLWYYHINGNDSTESFYNRYSLIQPGLTSRMGFTITDKYKTSINFISVIGTGKMELTDKKNTLTISITSLKPGYYNPFIYTNTDWEIRQLEEKLLKIRASINGNTYEILFTD